MFIEPSRLRATRIYTTHRRDMEDRLRAELFGVCCLLFFAGVLVGGAIR